MRKESEKNDCKRCGRRDRNKHGGCCTYKCRMMYEKSQSKCELCGNHYYPERASNKYCSDKCRNEVGRMKVKSNPEYLNRYKTNSFYIFLRSNFKCFYCGIPAEDTKLTIDHVYPQASGGGNDPYNLVS